MAKDSKALTDLSLRELDVVTSIASDAKIIVVDPDTYEPKVAPMGTPDDLVADTLQFNTDADEPEHQAGLLHWSEADGTLEIGMEVDGVKLQLGQESYLRAVNNTGVTIPNGAIIYVSDSTGIMPEVSLAKADSYLTSHGTMALATHSVADGTTGYFTTFGLARGYNTSGLTEGQEFYLSATNAGAGTITRPTGANHPVICGYCII